MHENAGSAVLAGRARRIWRTGVSVAAPSDPIRVDQGRRSPCVFAASLAQRVGGQARWRSLRPGCRVASRTASGRRRPREAVHCGEDAGHGVRAEDRRDGLERAEAAIRAGAHVDVVDTAEQVT